MVQGRHLLRVPKSTSAWKETALQPAASALPTQGSGLQELARLQNHSASQLRPGSSLPIL